MFQTKVEEKIKTYLSLTIFFFKSRVVRETMWKNMVQPDRSRMII